VPDREKPFVGSDDALYRGSNVVLREHQFGGIKTTVVDVTEGVTKAAQLVDVAGDFERPDPRTNLGDLHGHALHQLTVPGTLIKVILEGLGDP
jgi:hypothetical protein